MEIILVHGFRGDAEGLLGVGVEIAKKYSSGDIIVEDLVGKYAGKRVKYSGGEIFLPELPPFGGAGEMSKYFKLKRNDDETVSKKVKHKCDVEGKNFNDKRDGASKKINDRRNEGDEYSAEGYVEFLRGFIEDYGLRRPVLVGHSMGSLVVAATAERYPELVGKKVVLLAPISTRTSKFFTQLAPLVTLLPNKVVGWVTTRFLWVGEKGVLEEDLAGRLGEEGAGRGLTGRAGQGGARSAREIYQEALRLTYAGGGKYASKAAVRAATRFSTGYAVGDFDLGAGGAGVVGDFKRGRNGGVGEDFKQGRAGEGKDFRRGRNGEGKEVLLLAGEKDRLIPRRRTEELARERGWRVEFVAGAGHLLNYEREGEVGEKIAEFLESA